MSSNTVKRTSNTVRVAQNA